MNKKNLQYLHIFAYHIKIVSVDKFIETDFCTSTLKLKYFTRTRMSLEAKSENKD